MDSGMMESRALFDISEEEEVATRLTEYEM